MSKSYKTKGIVIRRKNIGEADRFLDVYTPSLGKVHLKAKGVRRTRSKLSGHLEIFNEVDLVIATGKSIDVVTGARLIKKFGKLRDNLRSVSAAYYFCELIYWLTEEGYKDTVLYEMLNWSLETLADLKSEDEKFLPLLVANVELQFLGRLGFQPELGKCAQSGQPLQPEGNHFSAAAGGVVCERGNNTVPISGSAIKVMRIMTEQRVEPARWQQIPPAVRKEVKKVVREFVHYTLERNLKAEGFLELTGKMPDLN